MATVTFDTDEAVQKLIAGKYSEEQARAIVRMVVDSQRELVTKTDLNVAIQDIRLKLIEHDGQFTLLKWMIGLVVAGVLSLVLKTFSP